MKIFCIGRNYHEHIKELQNAVPTEPLVFMKPRTAMLTDGKPFFFPEFTKEIHYEVELVLRIAKNGRHVQRAFASTYYEEIGVGIDFTARDIQTRCKEKGHPWELAKAFDHSAVVSDFVPFPREDKGSIAFGLDLNGRRVQTGDSSDMIFDFDTLVCYLSKFFTLQIGDLIFTGTPSGVGPIQIGDQLTGSLMGKELLHCEIK